MLTSAPKRSRTRDEGGFTLVETMVAALVLTIGILGGVTVFSSAGNESATGERQEVAAQLAQAELERLRDTPYSKLAIEPGQSWTASGQPGDPTGRLNLTSRTFNTGTAAGQEKLVDGASTGTGVLPYSTTTVSSAGATLNARIYRFVSWHDEDCPVLELGNLTGSLQGVTTPVQSLVGTILGPSGILNSLLGPLFNLLNPVIGNRLTVAKNLVTSIQTAVTGLSTTVADLDEIDPCDVDVSTLTSVNSTLTTLNPLLSDLNSRINAYNAGCTKLAGIVIACPGTGSALWTTLNNSITNLQSPNFQTQINDLVTSLGQLNLADHNCNTKRITVAVVLDENDGSGPFKPVWASSIASDPNTSLATGSCPV